jgi:hypothetical protein
VARVADDAIVRGGACERSYEALTQPGGSSASGN